ncbi:LIC_10190 family membrane protein [Chamaesiphon polymorphus]|uniref:DUF8201 domain-containing protein n=1 Tax=Chamaesiphon polymorphus CCALA 037 TaxID=2107692 RepID=A0A2T1GF57_9CYAN|nr:hypothetical protein [Chamaesiphon polymorphus]PSB56209.1 hypothetical protein C7B77_12640 [Chamaesiphon polymorphus CCALA 037]
MLYFISVWTLLLIGCCSCGFGLLNILEINIPRSHSPFSRLGDRAIVSTWLGMLAIAITLLATALFIPLSPLIGGVVFSIFLVISLRSRSTRLEIVELYRQISKPQILVYLGVAIALAAFFAQPVRWDDTGLYHYSLVRWFAQFGMVPGLALLFPNFGFTSAWFAFAAPLNPDWAIARTIAVTNGFIFLLAVLQLLISCQRLLRQQARFIDIFVAVYYSCILLLTIGTNLMLIILVSPSTDIPALLLVAIVTWAMLTIETAPGSDRLTPARQLVPLVIAVGAVSIKLTTLPLLLVTGLWFIFRAGFNRNIFQRMGIAAVVSLLLVPFLLSSIVTSGCPIYPSSAFCLNVPWAVGADRSTANATHHWVTWYGKPPAGIAPWLWAFKQWFATTTGNKITVLMSLISAGCAIYALKTRSCQRYLGSIGIFVVGISFFLMTSPLNRFMLPYFLIVPALAVAIYYGSDVATESLMPPLQASNSIVILPQKLPIHLPKLVVILPLIVAAISTVHRVQTDYSLLILPPARDLNVTIERQVNDVTYFFPLGSSPRCWTNELPCAYHPTKVRLRDPDRGIKAGFIRS